MLISSLYRRLPRKDTVNTRRIKKEHMRIKLANASYINVPRLVRFAESK